MTIRHCEVSVKSVTRINRHRGKGITMKFDLTLYFLEIYLLLFIYYLQL